MSAVAPLRLGTRGSALALAQSTTVADALRAAGREVELVEVSTVGDRSSAPIAELGGVGVFTSALREALLEGRVDLAVHSYKDLPTAPTPGVVLAAVPEREDAHDVLVSRSGLGLADLPADVRVGTGAPRRVAQVRLARPDVECVPLRGNVDSRLRRVALGELDAVVLARAGIARLGRLAEVTETLPVNVMLPAPAQGALAVECREADEELRAALRVLDHPRSAAAVASERALLATLEAGCSAPVGAFAEFCDVFGEVHLHLHGAVIAVDGSTSLRRSVSVPLHDATADAEGVGQLLAKQLLSDGAAALMGVEQ